METKKKEQESESKILKNKPYISKRSQKLAQRHANKSISSHTFVEAEDLSTPTEKVKRKLIFAEKSSDKKTFDIEYKKQHDFLLDCIKK